MAATQRYRLRVAEVIQETADSISIAFDPAPDAAAQFHYRPGQFLTLRIPSELTGSVARCYSLCSSPHTDDQLVVAVKRTVDGYASNWLCDHVTAGSELDVLPPSGSFGPNSFQGDFLLFAAGSGITPIMSIVKSVLSEGSGQVAVLYANRDADSVIFSRQLAALRATYPTRLDVTHWIEAERGLPSVGELAEYADGYPGRPAYACGPKGFMTVVQQALRASTSPTRPLHIENFVSLIRNPFEDDVAEADVAGAVNTSVTVELNGERHVLDWPDGVPLLELLLANGVDAPFACQEATCGSCACRVDDGKVEMRKNDALEQDDIDDGYVLACQSLPTGGDVRIVYD